MAQLFADGSAAQQDFSAIAGDDVDLLVAILDKDDKSPRDVSAFPDAVWELEGVEFAIVKQITTGGITRDSNTELRIALNDTETEDLRGVYTHQLRLVNANGDLETVMLGQATFGAQVIG